MNEEIARLVDLWCDRRNLHHLRTLLPYWPPPNGFIDEWQKILEELRHLRAMGRDDLQAHDEYESVSKIIAEITMRLHPQETSDHPESGFLQMIDKVFGKDRA